MSKLARYLDGEYEQIRARLDQLSDLVRRVAALFAIARSPDRSDWPYSWEPKKPPYFPQDKEGKRQYSFSTQAMCCSAVEQLMLSSRQRISLGAPQFSQLEKVQSETVTFLLNSLNERAKKNEPLWDSFTYGGEDVFTAAWLFQLHDEFQKSGRPSDWSPDLLKKLVKILKDVLVEHDDHIHLDVSLFKKKQNEAGAHPLPLLRATRALQLVNADSGLKNSWTLTTTIGPDEVIRAAGTWFERNLHRQMSFYHFKDFRFDAAELIFCLAGAVETQVIGESESILSDICKIIRGAQERSVYWRPYRPMLSDSQGTVLLPLSIEVATALLRTLSRTGRFHEFRDTLVKYHEWLAGQAVGDLQKEVVTGWHTENAYESGKIHLWDTALVVRFFLDYQEALEDEVNSEIIRTSKFTVHEWKTLPSTLDEMVPFDFGDSQVQKRSSVTEVLKAEFVEGRKPDGERKKYSLLLYGPPGVSKTTTAQAIAKQLQWDLVYLSPSDFITRGEAGIEEQTKLIFRALMALRDYVIVFDEIDRMVLDRESTAYGKQGDMFQFMTPGMLTKLNELRKQKRCIFVIATNFAEKIDRAIKREGRIDKAVLCLPYDLTGRTEQLKQLIDLAVLNHKNMDRTRMSELPPWDAAVLEDLRDIAKSASLYVYPELDGVAGECVSSVHHDDVGVFRKAVVNNLRGWKFKESQISIRSYNERTIQPNKEAKQYRERPYEEHASLLILDAESTVVKEPPVDLLQLREQWRVSEGEKAFTPKWQELIKRAEAYKIMWWKKLS